MIRDRAGKTSRTGRLWYYREVRAVSATPGCRARRRINSSPVYPEAPITATLIRAVMALS
jgi:hypothetical protein